MKKTTLIKVLKAELAKNQSDYAEFETIKKCLAPLDGQTITKLRFEKRMPSGWSRTTSSFGQFERISAVAPSGNTHPLHYTNAYYSDDGLEEQNLPYSIGARGRIAKIESLLSDEQKLKQLTAMYKKLGATLKALSEFTNYQGEYHNAANDNPAHYSIRTDIIKEALPDMRESYVNKLIYILY